MNRVDEAIEYSLEEVAVLFQPIYDWILVIVKPLEEIITETGILLKDDVESSEAENREGFVIAVGEGITDPLIQNSQEHTILFTYRSHHKLWDSFITSDGVAIAFIKYKDVIALMN